MCSGERGTNREKRKVFTGERQRERVGKEIESFRKRGGITGRTFPENGGKTATCRFGSDPRWKISLLKNYQNTLKF